MVGGRTVVLFHSTNYAIWASKELKRAGISYAMIPVPRHLSSDCGACLQIARGDAERVKKLLDARSVEYDRFEDL